jgi:hypothetical protein
MMLIRKITPRSGWAYQITDYDQLTVDEKRAEEQGRLQICIRDLPRDLAELGVDRLAAAYEQAKQRSPQ